MRAIALLLLITAMPMTFAVKVASWTQGFGGRAFPILLVLLLVPLTSAAVPAERAAFAQNASSYHTFPDREFSCHTPVVMLDVSNESGFVYEFRHVARNELFSVQSSECLTTALRTMPTPHDIWGDALRTPGHQWMLKHFPPEWCGGLERQTLTITPFVEGPLHVQWTVGGENACTGERHSIVFDGIAPQPLPIS